MGRTITDFTAELINSRAVNASKKLTESKILTEDPELDMPSDGIPEEEMPVDDIPEESNPEGEGELKNGSDFEEDVTNSVFWCNDCKKHFLATEDTPEGDIECPVCGSKEHLVDIGSAKEALENEENKEVAVDINDEEIPEEDEEPPVPEGEDFEEDGLEEALNILAQKYLSEKARIRIRKGTIKENGSVVLEGRVLPLKKNVTVVLENFVKNRDNSKFVLEGTVDLFKVGKLKVGIVKEGNTFKVKKVGYGILTESSKTPTTGIIG